MPLTKTGTTVKRSMAATYGEEKGERVFYASMNKGTPGSAKWHGRPAKKTSLAHRTLMQGRR
jgi:hypothetical protein